MSVICRLLYVFLCSHMASVSWGAIFTMDPSQPIMMEPNTIDLQSQEWSGSFSNFHQMKITNKEKDPKLLIFCETDSPVENVYLIFQFHENPNKYEYDLNNRPSAETLLWSSQDRQAKVEQFDQSYTRQGGRLKISLKGLSWTGKLWCEIKESERMNAANIISNELQLVDLRSIISDVINNAVWKVNIPLQTTPIINKGQGVTLKPYPNSQRGFFSSGLIDEPPAWYVADLISQLDYFDVKEPWQMHMKIIFGSPRSMKMSQEQMLSNKIGAYFIDKYGDIHINWNTEIKNEMSTFFVKREGRNCRGLVNYFTFGNNKYMYTLEPTIKNNIQQYDVPMFNLPKRVYPSSENMEIIVIRKQSPEYLECGFLSNDPNLSIKWFRVVNGVDVNMPPFEELGFVKMPSTASIRLINAKIDSTGTYKCVLLSDNIPVPQMEASFNIHIYQLPYFGEVTIESPGAGKPPPLIILMDGDSVEVKCIAEGYNGGKNENLEFTMIPLLDRSLSNAIQLNWTSDKPPMPVSSSWSSYAQTIVYKVYALQANIPTISKSQSHQVECAMKGKFKYMDYKEDVVKERPQQSKVYSHIIVNEKFIPDNMEIVPEPCAKRKNGCSITQENIFSCAMKASLESKLSKNHITWTLQWKIGDYTQEIIESEPSDNILNKYIRFANKSVTILPINSENDVNILNKFVKKVQCIFKLSYPNVTNKGWLKDKVTIIASKGTTLPPLDRDSFEFYSTENDDSMTHLIANDVYLSGTVTATVTQASLWIIAPICLAVLFILCFFIILAVLIARNKGETYAIDVKEREQGRDPVKELKENHFNEYVRPEQNNFLHGSRVSLNSSVHVASDNEDEELEEYASINQGKFDEDGSFIGDYTSEGKKRRKPDSRV